MFGKKAFNQIVESCDFAVCLILFHIQKIFWCEKRGDFRPRISKYFVYGPIGPHLILLYVLCQISLQLKLQLNV